MSSRQQLQQAAADSGFQVESYEKVSVLVRLLDVPGNYLSASIERFHDEAVRSGAPVAQESHRAVVLTWAFVQTVHII